MDAIVKRNKETNEIIEIIEIVKHRRLLDDILKAYRYDLKLLEKEGKKNYTYEKVFDILENYYLPFYYVLINEKFEVIKKEIRSKKSIIGINRYGEVKSEKGDFFEFYSNQSFIHAETRARNLFGKLIEKKNKTKKEFLKKEIKKVETQKLEEYNKEGVNPFIEF